MAADEGYWKLQKRKIAKISICCYFLKKSDVRITRTRIVFSNFMFEATIMVKTYFWYCFIFISILSSLTLIFRTKKEKQLEDLIILRKHFVCYKIVFQMTLFIKFWLKICIFSLLSSKRKKEKKLLFDIFYDCYMHVVINK